MPGILLADIFLVGQRGQPRSFNGEMFGPVRLAGAPDGFLQLAYENVVRFGRGKIGSLIQ